MRDEVEMEEAFWGSVAGVVQIVIKRYAWMYFPCDMSSCAPCESVSSRRRTLVWART